MDKAALIKSLDERIAIFNSIREHSNVMSIGDVVKLLEQIKEDVNTLKPTQYQD